MKKYTYSNQINSQAVNGQVNLINQINRYNNNNNNNNIHEA